MHNVGSQLIVSVALVSVVFCGGMDSRRDLGPFEARVGVNNWQCHREAFWLVIQAIAQRHPVLIHCLHVLQPTGDFVSLCFALCMWMCSTPVEPWSDCLRRGCQIFCLGPKLQERSAGVVTRSGHPRNLAVEYWRATTELYGALTPVDLRWLTESAASVESVASATAASATAAQDIAHQARRSCSSNSRIRRKRSMRRNRRRSSRRRMRESISHGRSHLGKPNGWTSSHLGKPGQMIGSAPYAGTTT